MSNSDNMGDGPPSKKQRVGDEGKKIKNEFVIQKAPIFFFIDHFSIKISSKEISVRPSEVLKVLQALFNQ
jgi:hypothetical protein